MSSHLSTAPHQSSKKRELTRAVETLKIKYGGERVRLILVLFRSDTPTHSTLQAINDGGLLITRFMRYWTVTPNQGTIL